jgi:DNA primase
MTPTDNPIEEIKNRLDIVEVIQEYIKLTKSGANWRALCPFHHEKTPSFMVSQEKQIWHCFGCDEGGDAFSFVMKMEGIEFPEALKIMAKKANVVLKTQNPELANKKTKLLDICQLAAIYFHKALLDSREGGIARQYLQERQFSEEIIEEFQLGYAPDSWDALSIFLKKKDYLEEEIFQAGLSVKREGKIGYYDRFRGRLIFPIVDHHDHVVGFGGRTLKQDEEEGAKYINSPQSLVYNKSYILYGLYKAKQAIKKADLVILVEGYTDCLASYQAGVKNVVATSGTALTLDQVKLLKRYTSNMAIAFDADLAGQSAAQRGIDIALAEEMNIKVITIPIGKDPDECIKKNKQAWLDAVAQAKSIIDYYFDKTLDQADLSKIEDKKKVVRTLLPVIAKLSDPLEHIHYCQQLAEILNVEERVLRDKLAQILDKKSPGSAKRDEVLPTEREKEKILSEQLIGLILKYPQHLSYVINELKPEYLSGEDLQKLYKYLIVYYTKKQQIELSPLLKELACENQELASYINILLLLVEGKFVDFDADQAQQEILNSLNILKKKFVSHQLKIIEQEIKRAEQNNDEAKISELSEQFSKFTQTLNKLK